MTTRSRTGVSGRGNPRVPTTGAYDAEQIIYVGKHGSDLNDGSSMARAKLTIGAAVTAAQAGTPAADNRYVIYAEDAGIYEEDIELTSWINLWMPSAKLTGQGVAAQAILLHDETGIQLHEVEAPDGQNVIVKSSTSDGWSFVDVDEINVGAGALGVINLGLAGGVLVVHSQEVYVGSGSIGIGDASDNVGHTHVTIEDIYMQGANATAMARIGTGDLVGRVCHIREEGAGVGTGTGLNVLGGEMDLSVQELVADVAYTVAGTAGLRIEVQEISGTQTEAAGSFVEVNGSGQSLTATTPFTSPAPTSGKERVVEVDTVTIGAPSTVNLPATPSLHGTVVVKDSTGGAAANNLTVQGNGNTIDGAATRVLSVDYEVAQFRWDGTEWKVVACCGASGGGGSAESEITAQLTGDEDDYSPTGWDSATHAEVDTDGSDYDITGFVAPTGSGAKRRTLVNSDATQSITLKHEDASSAAANRIITGGTDLVLGPQDIVTLVYSDNVSRWRVY